MIYINLYCLIDLSGFITESLCDLFLNYDYSKEYKEEIIDDDEELKIIKYEKSVLP